MQKQLLITFDYELYLGNRSGNIDECLFNPTESILKVIEQHNCKAIFFVDTTYLLTLKKQAASNESCKKDFDSVSAHVASLVKRGHYVFPHIHPHWLDAEYITSTNEWRLNNISKYRFHFLNEKERADVFDGSINILKEIILPENPQYKIDGYRAGGWCIQPFTDFLPYFNKHEIKFEFSVLGKIYLFSTVQYFDFSNAPEKTIYHFDDDVIKETGNGKFTQFNISSIAVSRLVHFANKVAIKILAKFFNDHSFSRGQGQVAVHLDKENFQPSVTGHNILDSHYERVAIELLTLPKLASYFRFFNQNNYMHFISHPKMITRHNVKMFDLFLNRAVNKFSVETDFKKMI